MFSSKLTFCCIVALYFTSSGASPVQEQSALQGADLEPYAAGALYVNLSSPKEPVSYVSGGVLYMTLTGPNIINTFTISDRATQSARYVAPNGRLDITVSGPNSQNRFNYEGTPNQPAIALLSVHIDGSNNINNINVGGSSVTANGNLRFTIGGSNNVNSVIVHDPSLSPADGRLQIAITGDNNKNTVIINDSPRQIV